MSDDIAVRDMLADGDGLLEKLEGLTHSPPDRYAARLAVLIFLDKWFPDCAEEYQRIECLDQSLLANS